MRYLCRLCSSTEKIIDVYHTQLQSGEQLRRYIALASGIEILWNDPISRMVCHRCCEIAVKLNKYRCNAVANDKSLKEKFGQPYSAPITDKDELLSAASRIFNLNDISITKEDADPLELLNRYIDRGSVKPTKINNDTSNKTSTISEGNTISKNRLSSPSTVSSVVETHEANSSNDANPYSNSVEEPVKPVIPNVFKPELPLNNATIKSKPPSPSILKSGSGDSSNSADKENKDDDAEWDKIKCNAHAHPSVKKLYKEYHSIQLPTEVLSLDISPNVSIDPAEVSDWYAEQLQELKDKLKSISNNNPSNLPNSSDDDDISRPRLRKRKCKRVLACIESDDDDEWVPSKVHAQDSKGVKPTRSTVPSSVTTPLTAASKTVNSSSAASGSNYSVINTSTQQHGNGGLKLKIMKQSPTPVTMIPQSDPFLTSQPNSRVLQSLLTSNDQTLANLYTDFSRYGINIENSEPPILYENPVECPPPNSLADMLLDTRVALPATSPIAPKPIANDDVICISDDENDPKNDKLTDSREPKNSNESEMLKMLLRKHLSKTHHKDTQTFHPNDFIIHRTKTNLIALPNMVEELRRYKIPIDLKYSTGNVAHFEKVVKHGPPPILDQWALEDCVDISKVIPTIRSSNDEKNKVLSNAPNSRTQATTLWNNACLQRINDAIKNNFKKPPVPSTVPATLPTASYQTISNRTPAPSTVVYTVPVTVAIPNTTTYQTISNQTSVPTTVVYTVPITVAVSNTTNYQTISNRTPASSTVLYTVPVTIAASNTTNYQTNPTITQTVICDKVVSSGIAQSEWKGNKPIQNGSKNLSLRSLLYPPNDKNKQSRQQSCSDNSGATSPLLQNYLQTNAVGASNNIQVPVLHLPEEQFENVLPTISAPIVKDTLPNDNLPKLRVKSMDELLPKSISKL